MSVPAPSKALASICSLIESLRASTAARTYSVLSLVLEALFFIVAKFYSKTSKAAISDIDVYNTSMALFVSVICAAYTFVEPPKPVSASEKKKSNSSFIFLLFKS